MSNKVVNTSVEYENSKRKWVKCRDAIEGQQSIKDKRETYLPKLSGQDSDQYEKYIKQAMFYNTTGRTFKAFKGFVFRKDPDINAEGLDEFVADCDLAGTSLVEFAEEAVKEELTTARFGILVDHPDMSETGLSQAEAQEQGRRPYFVAYKAESILSVRTGRVGNKTMLTQVRLLESVEEETDDEFEFDTIRQVRVLDLVEGMYRQRLFRQDSENPQWVLHDELFPKMNGQSITEIPFYVTGGYDYRTPYLLDLVNVNLSHYIAYADHRAGVSWTTRPQPYATGIQEDDLDDLTLGGGTMWRSGNKDARFGMLEYSGSGLSGSENNLIRLEEMMSTLGVRMLDPASNQETATEFVIKKEGEHSSLGDVSKVTSQCLTKAMRFVALWSGYSEEQVQEVEIRLNTDFVPFEATPDQLLKMITAVQTGEYARSDYNWWLKQNEMVDPTISDDERLSEIQTTAPDGMNHVE